jgi:hypothetical protein
MVVNSQKVVGPLARMGGERNAHSDLVRKFAVKRPLGRPRHKWENNIKMYLYGNGGHALTISIVSGFTIHLRTAVCNLAIRHPDHGHKNDLNMLVKNNNT